MIVLSAVRPPLGSRPVNIESRVCVVKGLVMCSFEY